MTVTSKFLCCKYIYLTLSRSASSEVQRCWCSLPTAARVFYSMNIHYIRLARQIQPLWGWISGFIHQHLELMQTTAQQLHNNGAHLPTTEVGMFPASPDRVFPIDVCSYIYFIDKCAIKTTVLHYCYRYHKCMKYHM